MTAAAALLLCFTLKFSHGISIGSAEGGCGAPPEIENSQNNSTGPGPYPPGTVMTYSCKRGYSWSGYKHVKCQSSGIWWQHEYYPMTCKPISCGDPGTPPNGEKDTYLYTLGSVVRYTCDEGYELIGYSNRQCLVDGEWSRATPSCNHVKCPPLEAPENGTLDSNRREYGSRVNLECDPGYRTGITHSRICQGNKTWSGTDFVCQEINCGPHPHVPNADVEPRGDNKWGEAVRVRCRSDAISSTPELPYNVIHCSDDGSWSPRPQTCWGCCDVTAVVGDNSAPYISDQECVPHEDTVSSGLFSCGAGYYIDDPQKQLECTNGTLFPPPSCSRITCPIPYVKNGAIVGGDVGQTLDFGSEINVTCDSGYQVNGKNPVRCDRDVLYPECQVKLLKRAKRLDKCRKWKLNKLKAKNHGRKAHPSERHLITMDCYMLKARIKET